MFATFQSGADVAWLTDEIGEEAAQPMYLRSEQWWQAGSLVGIAVGVTIASFSTLRAPILFSGLGFVVLGVFMALAMREEGFRPERREGERLHTSLATTVREGVRVVRAHHVLLLILATAALHGVSTEGFDRLSDLHLLEDIGLPTLGGLALPVWFGILDGGALLLGIGALAIVKRRVHLQGHAAVARVLAGGRSSCWSLSVVAFAVVASFWWALAAFWLVGTLRSVREPVFTAWINQGLDAKTRATINSVGSQSDAIGQAAGGPGIGLSPVRSRCRPRSSSRGCFGCRRCSSTRGRSGAGTVGTLAPDEIDEELHLEDAPAEGRGARGTRRAGAAVASATLRARGARRSPALRPFDDSLRSQSRIASAMPIRIALPPVMATSLPRGDRFSPGTRMISGTETITRSGEHVPARAGPDGDSRNSKSSSAAMSARSARCLMRSMLLIHQG